MDIRISSLIATIVSEVIIENTSRERTASSFDSCKIPQISVEDYLQRIVKFTHCSQESLVLALIYIDRIILANQTFFISQYNVHR
jgi:hypothetical protein